MGQRQSCSKLLHLIYVTVRSWFCTRIDRCRAPSFTPIVHVYLNDIPIQNIVVNHYSQNGDAFVSIPVAHSSIAVLEASICVIRLIVWDPQGTYVSSWRVIPQHGPGRGDFPGMPGES